MGSNLQNIIPSSPADFVDSSQLVTKSLYIPKTRYYGSKKRVLSWLTSTLAPLGYQTVLDVFGGTGLVSLAQKQAGKKVTYNDMFYNCHYTARSFLSNETRLNKATLEEFCENVEPFPGFITKEFDGYFYTDQENQWLDGFLKNVSEICGQEHLELMHCLMQACLQKRPFNIFHRKNLYLRLNCNKKTKFGNWRTWERPFQELMTSALFELQKTTFNSGIPVEFLRPTDASEVGGSYDLVYIDPPYITGRGADVDYMDRYHFLEGMANYDSWSHLINNKSSVKALLKTESVSDWNNKKTFKNRLFDLIFSHRSSIVALSYVTSAYPDQKEIVTFFQNNFSRVIFSSTEISHALSKGKKSEFLVVGIPKT